MQGGRVIGEGVDGCILTEPMWPCSSNSVKSGMPPLKSDKYVSKITHKEDNEDIYRTAAQNILGPLANKYLTILESQCAPTDSRHPPLSHQRGIYKSSQASLLSWAPKGQACGELKDIIKRGKPISDTHKVMYISRYNESVKDWLSTTRDSMNTLFQLTIPGVRPFLEILQMLHQGRGDKLIHLDLHIGNIFVKRRPIQFGLTDFGHCLLRRASDTPEEQARTYFGKYLCEYIVKYEMSKDYRQVPLEARLLNFCFRKNLESVSPGSLVKAWEEDTRSIKRGSADLVIMEAKAITEHLLKKPLFIQMIETLQNISKKLKAFPESPVEVVQSLKPNETAVLEYILTRYNCISPINSITEAILMTNTSYLIEGDVSALVQSYIHGKKYFSSKLQPFIEFILEAIMAPYEQEGSSLSAAVTSVQGGDIRIIWDAVVRS